MLTEAETDNPEAELKPGVELLAPVDEIFYETYDRYKPTNDPDSEHCYISMVLFSITTISSFQSHLSYIYIYTHVLQSYDPSTHFESTVEDVLAMYTKITGKVQHTLLPQILITNSS